MRCNGDRVHGPALRAKCARLSASPLSDRFPSDVSRPLDRLSDTTDVIREARHISGWLDRCSGPFRLFRHESTCEALATQPFESRRYLVRDLLLNHEPLLWVHHEPLLGPHQHVDDEVRVLD